MVIYMSNDKLKDILIGYDYSIHNKELLEKTDKCGCYYCLEIFNTNEIEDYIEEEDTALCPYCGADSVIPEINDIKITEDFLKSMNEYWFNGKGK